MKTKNIDHKKRLLKENYNRTEQEVTFNEWLANELYHDPGIGRWLTDNDDFDDFQLPDNYEDLFDHLTIREDLFFKLKNKDKELLKKVEELVMLSHTSELYHAWYIMPDGSNWISTAQSSNTYEVIKGSNMEPVAILCKFQYFGSCNCDYCTQLHDDPDNQGFDIVHFSEEVNDLIEDICDNLQSTGRHRGAGIAGGYFNDEEEE